MYEVYVAAQFEAAHRLVGDFGPATRMHGHTYRLEVIVRGKRLSGDGTLYDIGRLRSALWKTSPLAPLPRSGRGVWPRERQHDRRGGGGLLLGEARADAARRWPRLAHRARLGVAAGLRCPRRFSRLNRPCASPSSRWGIRSVLTGGYLYNARVLLGLRENGVEIEEIVPCGASIEEQEESASRLGTTWSPTLRRYRGGRPGQDSQCTPPRPLAQERPVVAMVHELPSVAAPKAVLDREREYEEPLLRAELDLREPSRSIDPRREGVPPRASALSRLASTAFQRVMGRSCLAVMTRRFAPSAWRSGYRARGSWIWFEPGRSTSARARCARARRRDGRRPRLRGLRARRHRGWTRGLDHREWSGGRCGARSRLRRRRPLRAAFSI